MLYYELPLSRVRFKIKASTHFTEKIGMERFQGAQQK